MRWAKRGRVVCGLLFLVASCSSPANNQPQSQAPPTSAPAPDVVIVTAPHQEGVQRLHFSYGPIKIAPGQNNITFSEGQVPKPTVDGFIVSIYPNLVRNDGSVPPVDIVHLHHGVWLTTRNRVSQTFFAAGEEKTSMILPAGYGFPYKASDSWVINYMLHNLLPTPDEVSITYDLDFIPADAPVAPSIKAARPIWMDVQNGSIYPVFDVHKGSGTNGLLTYPDQVPDAYKGRAKNESTVDRDTVLLATAGHLHPGGQYTDLFVKRAGAAPTPATRESVTGDQAHLFRSEAVYFEPAGAVSWDVSMGATPPEWRVAVKKGDVLSISATYDTNRGSWYESMGIMVVWATDGTDGPDPFQARVDAKGVLTHGHLAENDNHGGGPAKFADMVPLPNGPVIDTVTVADYTYGPGDMSGIYSNVPVVRAGQPLTFVNKDAPLERGTWHTITSCKAPCNKATGVAYPLADADIQFDSGELGAAGPPTAGRVEWATPPTLPAGTYTYFCRIHPSMRGAFRVATA